MRRAFIARIPDARLGTSRFGPDIEALATNRRLDNLLAYRIVFGLAQVSNYGDMAGALEDLVAALNETVE